MNLFVNFVVYALFIAISFFFVNNFLRLQIFLIFLGHFDFDFGFSCVIFESLDEVTEEGRRFLAVAVCPRGLGKDVGVNLRKGFLGWGSKSFDWLYYR